MEIRREINTEEFSSRIAILSSKLQQDAAVNLQSAMVHAEEVFKRILNSLYGFNLKNANEDNQNADGIDLVDDIAKTVIQVTVSATRKKIENTLAKSVMKQYAQNGYHLKFMFIGTKQLQKPKKPFANPYSIKFEYTRDCLYGSDLVAAFSRLDIKNQEAALLILKQELGEEFLVTDSYLIEHFGKQKSLLGARYSPSLTVNIDESDYLDAFSNPERFNNLIQNQVIELSNAIDGITDDDLSALEVNYVSKISELKDLCEKAAASLSSAAVKSVCDAAREILYDPLPKELGGSCKAKLNAVKEACTALRHSYHDSGYSLIEKSFILFTGNGGIGKSHYLADCCDKTIHDGGIAFLVLGQLFVQSQGPCEQLASFISGKTDFSQCFSEINRFAVSHNRRALIAIDALNEGDGKTYWRNHLTELVEALAPYKNIVLLASVRSTYENAVVPSSYFDNRSDFARIELRGFENSPDAIRLFCNHYGIEPPAFPPYGEEYSNPLYLKILCDAIVEKNTGRFELNISFSEAVSLCINAVDDRIKNALQCYTPINIAAMAIYALAGTESFSDQGYVPYEEAFMAVSKAVSPFVTEIVKLLELLEAENLIRIDSYASAGYVDFCYERFGDYVYARNVISSATNGQPSRPQAIRASSAIHDLLCSSYRQGAAEALAILLIEDEGINAFELLDLSDEFESNTAFKLLLASIPWNKRHNLSDCMKDYIFNSVANNPNRLIRFMAELLSVSLSPTSAFNALLFDEVARSVPPQKRDGILAWAFYSHANITSTLDWLQANHSSIPSDCIDLAVTFLPWLFASTNIEIRDKATKALSLCLIRKPEASEALSSALGSYDDDYVDERIIASIYGSTANSCSQYELYLPACQNAYDFTYGQQYTHPNIMVRNYTDCLIDFMIQQSALAESDFDKCFAGGNCPWYEKPVTNEDIDNYLENCKTEFGDESNEAHNLWWIIHSMTTEYGRGTCCYGDFGRYTLGSQVRCWRNQFKNDQDLANLALKELLDHFYSPRWHVSFDRNVGHMDGMRNVGFERLSKKYQWICMHRLIGRLVDNYPPYEESVVYDQEYRDYQYTRSLRFREAFEQRNYFLDDEEAEMDPSEHIVEAVRRPLEADEMFWELEGLRDLDPTYLKTDNPSYDNASEALTVIHARRGIDSMEELYADLAPLHSREINNENFVAIWTLINIKDPNDSTKETHWQSFAGAIGKSHVEKLLSEKKSLMSEVSHSPETLHLYCRETGGCYASVQDAAFRDRDRDGEKPRLSPLSIGYLWEPVRDGTNMDGESARVQRPSDEMIDKLGLTQTDIGIWEASGAVACFEEITEYGKRLLIREDLLHLYLKQANSTLGWNEYYETTTTSLERNSAWLLCLQKDNGELQYEPLDRDTHKLNPQLFA